MTSLERIIMVLILCLQCHLFSVPVMAQWLSGSSTRFYDFKVQTTTITKLCNTLNIVTVNGMLPGPAIYAGEDDRVIVKVTNQTPHNITIHWHGVRQKLSCWFDGPSYVTQCPIQTGQSFSYEFRLVGQKGTLLWHAHLSWLRATVHGAIVVYPKNGVPYPFPSPYEEHVIILGEFWLQDMVELEQSTIASGGGPRPADAFTINGHPGPNYNCSENDVYILDVIPWKSYMLRIINGGLNSEYFFSIVNHKLKIVEVDGEYTKPFVTDRLMLGPGQTMNVLVTADQPIGKYSVSVGPYMSARGILIPYQNKTSIAYFNYLGAELTLKSLPSMELPLVDDNLAVKTVMDGLRSLNHVHLPQEIDTNLFVTVGLNVEKCRSKSPKQACQGPNNGVMAASMNNISFIKPKISILEAYYKKINGFYTEDFPGSPLEFYDFVNGGPNNTESSSGTRVKVVEYGSKVQVVLQDTGIVTTENHPIHLHGFSFYFVGYGSGNYDGKTAVFNLEDPPLMNVIGVPVGGWAAIRFIADNPGVWFMHCHIDIHQAWGLGTVLIVKNGEGELQTLPPPPRDLPYC